MKKRPTDDFAYKDLPELREIFADDFHAMTFDGQVAMLTLTVDRFDEIKPPKKPTGRKVTAARLALTPNALMKLHNQLTQLVAALEQQGVVKREDPTGGDTMQ